MSKTCPECNSEVPDYAQICKECDYDFPSDGPSKGIPIGLSITILLLGLIGVGLTSRVASQKQVNRYVLDTEAETILHIQGTPKGLHANSTPFKDVIRLALIIGGSDAKYAIVATNKQNQELVLSKSESPLERQATNISDLSGLELIIDNRLQIDL